MGKRYGRNQKRAARKVIAQMQAAYTREAELLKHAADRARELEWQIANFAEALGVNYVGLPAREITLRVHDLTADDSFRAVGPNGAFITMNLMRAEGRHDERSNIHFHVRLGPALVAYSISSRALMTMPPRYISRQLAGEMAPALLNEIRRLGFSHD